MIAMKLERMLEYLDLADPVGVEVHFKILYATYMVMFSRKLKAKLKERFPDI